MCRCPLASVVCRTRRDSRGVWLRRRANLVSGARPRLDEVTGHPLFRGTFADPSAEKDREKSVTVEFACAHQPVPPEAVPGLPFRPVVLEGMTVQPRAEASGQAKWLTWVIRAVGMTAPGASTGASGAVPVRSAASGTAVKSAAA
jgi:hypothetical protein